MSKPTRGRTTRSTSRQAGRYVVTWILGVVVATILIGGGLFFGLGMLEKDSSKSLATPASLTNSMKTGNTAPDQAADAGERRVGDSEIGSSDGNANSNLSIQQSEQQPQAPEQPAVSAMAAGVAPAPETETRAPVTRIAPRAPTAGGLAAARLPTGEEILVPAGERVDEYVRKRAAELGITMPEQEDGSNAIVEPLGLDELSEAEIRELEEAERELFQDEDTVGNDNYGLEADDPNAPAQN